MLVEIGHIDPLDGPVVTETRVSDLKDENGEYLASYIVGTDAMEILGHLFDNPGLVTHLPGNTAIPQVVGQQRDRVVGPIYWVAVTPEDREPEVAADFERFLAELHRCPAGKPADVEDTHWTLHGNVAYRPGDRPVGGTNA